MCKIGRYVSIHEHLEWTYSNHGIDQNYRSLNFEGNFQELWNWAFIKHLVWARHTWDTLELHDNSYMMYLMPKRKLKLRKGCRSNIIWSCWDGKHPLADTGHRPRERLDFHSLGRAHPTTTATVSTHPAGVWAQGSRNKPFSTLLFFPVRKEVKVLGFTS